jgi:uncharacterized RDD family membrane protein YckC
MYCPNCGVSNEKGAEKCVNCGKPLPQLSPTGDLLPGEEPKPAVVPPASPVPADRPTPAYHPGLPGSQYSYSYGAPGYPPPPGPAYNQYQYAPYYNYSTPVDRVGIAPVEAGFWTRLGAYLIDNILMGIIGVVVFVIPLIIWGISFVTRYQDQILPVCDSSRVGYSSRRCNDVLNNLLSRSNELGPLLWLVFGLGGLVILITLLYYVLMTARGATIGKKVFGLKVVKADGTPPGFGRALLRQTIGYFVSSFFWLGFIWIAFDPQRQGWHDKIAGTYVVRAG